MNVYVFIPARYASTRLPGKPLTLFAGKPMIQHVYERAMQAKNVAGVYVATDDERIADVVRGFGGQVVMTPVDAPSGTDRIAAAARTVGLADDDLIVNVQGDQPLIDPATIEDVISPFLAADYDGSFKMSTLSIKITQPEEIHSPQAVKVVTNHQGMALYFSRASIPFGRDNWQHDVFKHLGIYAYTKGFIDLFTALPVSQLENIEMLEQLRALENGHAIKVIETRHDSPEVNVPEDVPIVTAHFAKNA